MATNYYQMKIEAAKLILDAIEYLHQNPENIIPFDDILLQFSHKFGFGERILGKMLEPHINKRNVFIVNGCLTCKEPSATSNI